MNNEPRIMKLHVNDETITAQLADGRTDSVPLAWSWRLSQATPKQRKNFEILGNGEGVHWPAIDEDISAQGMLHGIPARHEQDQTTNVRLISGKGHPEILWKDSMPTANPDSKYTANEPDSR